MQKHRIVQLISEVLGCPANEVVSLSTPDILAIADLLGRIPERRLSIVLCAWYLDGRSLKEIGKTLDLSQERTRYIKGRSCQFLRRWHADFFNLFRAEGIRDTSLALLKRVAALEKEVHQLRATLAGYRFVIPATEGLLSRSVDTLGLSVRTMYRLKNAGLATIGQLVHKTDHELLLTKSFGEKSLAELRAALSKLGLSLTKQT